MYRSVYSRSFQPSVGTATGWVELRSQGGTGTFSATEPAASDHGYLWDSTALEGLNEAGTKSAVITPGYLPGCG